MNFEQVLRAKVWDIDVEKREWALICMAHRYEVKQEGENVFRVRYPLLSKVIEAWFYREREATTFYDRGSCNLLKACVIHSVGRWVGKIEFDEWDEQVFVGNRRDEVEIAVIEMILSRVKNKSDIRKFAIQKVTSFDERLLPHLAWSKISDEKWEIDKNGVHIELKINEEGYNNSKYYVGIFSGRERHYVEGIDVSESPNTGIDYAVYDDYCGVFMDEVIRSLRITEDEYEPWVSRNYDRIKKMSIDLCAGILAKGA